MEQKPDAEAKTEARNRLLLAVIFGGLIVGLIAVMFFIETYGESQEAGSHKVQDAADS